MGRFQAFQLTPDSILMVQRPALKLPVLLLDKLSRA